LDSLIGREYTAVVTGVTRRRRVAATPEGERDAGWTNPCGAVGFEVGIGVG